MTEIDVTYKNIQIDQDESDCPETNTTSPPTSTDACTAAIQNEENSLSDAKSNTGSFQSSDDDPVDREVEFEVDDDELLPTAVISEDQSPQPYVDIVIDSNLELPIASIVGNGNLAYPALLPSALVEAGAVSFAVGEPFNVEADTTHKKSSRRRAFLVFCVLFFNVTLIIALVVLRMPNNKDISSPEVVDVLLSTDAEDEEREERRELIKYYILLETGSYSKKEMLDNNQTVQYEALEFLVNEDLFYVELNRHKLYVQRYLEILLMICVSGKPHLILPDYKTSRNQGDFLETISINLSERPLQPGFIPYEVGFLVNLQDLILTGNAITGTIPSSLGLLSSLSLLDLSGNDLSGTIPKEIGNLSQMNSLLLNNNKLIGTVPSTLANLTLQALALEQNNLTGYVTLCDGDFPGGPNEEFTADCSMNCTCCSNCL